MRQTKENMATEFTYKDLAVIYEDNHVIVVV